MNEKEAIELASRFARGRGRDVDCYEASAELDDGEWRVAFRPRGQNVKPGPGDFFTVYVDDASGAVRRMAEGK
jgi:hypothetical protein